MIKGEQACQINLVNWIKYTFESAKKDLYHFANERKCTPQHGRILQRMGVQAGVADLFIGIPRHGKGGLWLEIKIDKNQLSPAQKEFLERQIQNNFAAACCWDLDACMRVVGNYFADDVQTGYFDQVIYQKS